MLPRRHPTAHTEPDRPTTSGARWRAPDAAVVPPALVRMSIAIRPPSIDELPALRAIERLAGERFREMGLPEVADDEPPPLDVLARYAGDGRCWVAVDDAAGPIGYVVVDSVDGNAHVEQVSVHPAHQGAGVGRALIERVSAWAGESGMPAVTLTTFSDVPWNAPLYRHLGFRVARRR